MRLLQKARIRRSRTQIHEIIFSSLDKPRLLNKLSTLLSEIGLNIREAHVFSTKDGHSLDVFVVDGWDVVDTVGLHKALEASILRNMVSWFGFESLSLQPFSAEDCVSDIDITLLSIKRKLTSGSCGDAFLGTYGGEEVSVKVLRYADLSQILWKEFKDEILMLREVDHANTFRLVGSCTKPPQFCTITGYESAALCWPRSRCLQFCYFTLGANDIQGNTSPASRKCTSQAINPDAEMLGSLPI
ncbi:serine/threonine-protein kinase STY8 [Brachypodium distachyon]|uniref:serine/threonine-protein kinase STY8 n=1 Tax=Brachypodium distachyon TaxID=15368 RepID=UPI000D0CABB0|nr:serine/threonine-protein kinase STY8 [Brachypodium distachyon]|eukprot:XP_024314078.1 serine/threonine-protein kinase STY8 [Brachypodium distachyon]